MTGGRPEGEVKWPAERRVEKNAKWASKRKRRGRDVEKENK